MKENIQPHSCIYSRGLFEPQPRKCQICGKPEQESNLAPESQTIVSDNPLEDQCIIQKEMLELVIKAGRRLMHDFKHMLDEVPNNNAFKDTYQQRAKIWENIFYPDNGPKNYRSSLHQEIMRLEFELKRTKDLLKKHGIDSTEDLPF